MKLITILSIKWKLMARDERERNPLGTGGKTAAGRSLDDVINELEFRQVVQQGLDELDRGQGIPNEQVKARIASWAGK